jgi:hypothetical protein
MAKQDFRIVGWVPHDASPCAGEIWVELACGMIVRSIKVFVDHSRPRIAFPCSPLLDDRGNIVKNCNNKPYLSPLITFDDIRKRKIFNDEVLHALVAVHPDALGLEGGYDPQRFGY